MELLIVKICTTAHKFMLYRDSKAQNYVVSSSMKQEPNLDTCSWHFRKKTNAIIWIDRVSWVIHVSVYVLS